MLLFDSSPHLSSLFQIKKFLVGKTTPQNFHFKIQCILTKHKRVMNVLHVFMGLIIYNHFKINAPGRIRTFDLRIRSPIQLSSNNFQQHITITNLMF